MARLAQKVAIVTGAGSGIARVATDLFAREGARVVAAELNPELGEASANAARERGGDATFVRTDVTDEASVQDMVAQTRALYGRVDVLFNCAGGSLVEDKQAAEVDMSIWERTIGLDLKGPFLCARHVIPEMRKAGGGSIVNVSSIVALRGSFEAHIYTSAKGGVISFTRALAGAYARDRIRANVICPGVIMTERVKRRFASGGERDPAALARNSGVESLEQRYPFGIGEPADIARVALFLASDESRMVNGAVIPADGGMSAY